MILHTIVCDSSFLAFRVLETPNVEDCRRPTICVAVSNQEVGKSKVINKAIQDVGMGTYQWKLFVLCGFGWLADK